MEDLPDEYDRIFSFADFKQTMKNGKEKHFNEGFAY
jgi:hypothetical protein